MTRSQLNFTWLEEIYQPKNFQTTIFTGFDLKKLNPISVVIDDFVNTTNFDFFNQYYKLNMGKGGRPPYDLKVLLKIYMYALYKNIHMRELHQFYHLGSDLHFLSRNLTKLPNRKIFSYFLKILDKHIDEIFILHIEYLRIFISLNFSILYCDGTIFEAHNNRHKIITDTNIMRSNKKWSNILNNVNSDEKLKELAKEKLKLNTQRTTKLNELNRNSYGRTDEDCVILKSKGGAYIAGYNAQFFEESNLGIIVYVHVSNKNPDSVAFLEIMDDVIETYHPTYLVVDTGYGTPEIVMKAHKQNVKIVVKALKNENAKKKITDYSFELSPGEDYLICLEGQILEKEKYSEENNLTTFKANNCDLCSLKQKCCKKAKVKRVKINIEEFKALKEADKMVNSELGLELYSHRGNKCESPHGFIMYNLNGQKLTMNGIDRILTIAKLDAMLYNFRRLISVKLAPEKKSENMQK